MKISTYKNCLVAYTDGWSGWQKDFDIEREESLKVFPYSVIVEGDLLEINSAIVWCIQLAGQPDVTSELVYLENSSGIVEEIKRSKNGNWKSFFFDKIDYDYGFCEFFFKEKAVQDRFKEEVPNFYGVFPTGKFKTNGSGVFVESKADK